VACCCYLMHYKNDVDTNIVAVHHGFLTNIKHRNGKEKEMNGPIVHRKWKWQKERGDKFCFVSSVLQKNVPIMALAGTTKVAEYL